MTHLQPTGSGRDPLRFPPSSGPDDAGGSPVADPASPPAASIVRGSMADDRGLRALLMRTSGGSGDSTTTGGAARAPLAEAAAAAIAKGRATPKSGGPEGSERLLSARHAQRISHLAEAVAPKVRAAIEADLAALDGPAAALAKTIYLKAAAARSGPLLDGPPAARHAALATLRAFSGRIAGLSREDLLEGATVLDLDSRVSSSTFDPMTLDEARGVTHAAEARDTDPANDGLFQRFMGSCGTATLQMALAEDDPVRAFVIHDAGLHSTAEHDVVGRFQAEVLGEFGSVALGRGSRFELARLRNALGRLKRRGAISKKDAAALVAYGESRGDLTPGATRALEAVRARYDGFPSDAVLQQVRRDPVHGEDGLTLQELQKALDEHLGSVTGVHYRIAGGPDGIARGEAGPYLDAVTRALQQGFDVPLGTTGPGHYMLMSAVEGQAPERRFLVSDPWDGRTAWVPERDLISGRFTADPFFQADLDKPGFVDSFYLPKEA